MKIGVLGTGIVGQAHASKLSSLGHDIYMGTRDVEQTLSRTGTDSMGRPHVSLWLIENPAIKLVPLDEAAESGDIIIEALSGLSAVKTLRSVRRKLRGKILIDISNPIVFHGGKLKLFTTNDDSLGQQIQSAMPDTKVVKAFNTMNALVQVEPLKLAKGDHHLFIAGEDDKAKIKVKRLAKEWYGWKNILDLGGIESARGMEMVLPIWLDIMKKLDSPKYNFKIVK